MGYTFFANASQIFGGLFVGIAFGFLLRKARVTKFDVIVKQLMLRDFTVMKVMLTAIAFGSLGTAIYAFFSPMPAAPILSTTLAAAGLGGALFGIGMATLGFCPGTAIASLADGARDARYGIFGMIAGALLYAELAPFFATCIKMDVDHTQATLADLTSWPRLLFTALFFSIVALMKWLDRRADHIACSKI